MAVGAGPWVVPGRRAVGPVVRVVDRVHAAVPDIGRIVVTGAPDRAAPGDHHARVAGNHGEGRPVVVALVFDHRDVRDVVRRRARGNLVDRLRDGGGHF